MTEPADPADRAWQLADEGMPVAAIARELGVSRERVYQWLAADEAPLSRAWLFRDPPAVLCLFCLGESKRPHDRSCPTRGRVLRLAAGLP